MPSKPVTQRAIDAFFDILLLLTLAFLVYAMAYTLDWLAGGFL